MHYGGVAFVVAVCLLLSACPQHAIQAPSDEPALPPANEVQETPDTQWAALGDRRLPESDSQKPPRTGSHPERAAGLQGRRSDELSAGKPIGQTARPARAASDQRPRFSPKSALYDRAGPAFGLLQSARQAMLRFPADSLGNVDWVQALELGLITPRATLSGSGQMTTRDDSIIMRNTRDMPWVRFPHRQHTEWLACSNCHPRPFEEKAGANEINMDDIMRGRQCGLCHDRVAFSIFACERCHSITHPGSPEMWW